MEKQFPVVERSGQFMLFFQADGICQALRLIIQAGQSPGPATVDLLKAMLLDALKIGKGLPFERLPKISSDSPASDMLVAAELIRATMLAFLSPEEVEQQRRSIGFAQS